VPADTMRWRVLSLRLDFFENGPKHRGDLQSDGLLDSGESRPVWLCGIATIYNPESKIDCWQLPARPKVFDENQSHVCLRHDRDGDGFVHCSGKRSLRSAFVCCSLFQSRIRGWRARQL
jgi:hypothetical protein